MNNQRWAIYMENVPRMMLQRHQDIENTTKYIANPDLITKAIDQNATGDLDPATMCSQDIPSINQHPCQLR
jgi:hypothetical protein